MRFYLDVDGQHHFSLSIWNHSSVYRLLFVPSRIIHSSDYDGTTTLLPSSFRCSRTSLSINYDCHIPLCVPGPSGMRVVYIERSRHNDRASELVVYTGPFRGSPLASHAMCPSEDLERAMQTILPSPIASRRAVLPGMISRITRTADKMAFDERSGRICLRHGEGSITVVDFGSVEGVLPHLMC